MSLLCAFPMLSSDEFLMRMPKLWQAIEGETHPSTRYYIEWLMVLGILRHGDQQTLGHLMTRFMEFKWSTGTAISLLTIAMHVGLHLPENSTVDGEMRGFFFNKIFHYLQPWFLHNNHMVRLFALFVFERLWHHHTTTTTDDSTITDVLGEGFKNMAAFLEQSDQSKKFTMKLYKEYFLGPTFNPISNFDIQTIFSTLPSEGDIAKNECISMVF